MASKASAVWTGSLKEGKGTISTATGVLKDANYSFATRFEGAASGTTPEELIAAAHASCFSMALGAQLGDVLKLVLVHGLKLTIIGAVLGLVGALLATRAITSVLYGVSATDPLTFGFVSFLLIGVALVACYIPARRATKVEPLTALRNE